MLSIIYRLMDYISIIIPAYNSALWIGRCLDSVLSAADKACEIIVVDDGSTDMTLEIVRQYELADDRVLLVESDHKGQGSARKEGFNNSSGDWVMFVDSDDTLPSNAIADYRRYMSDECDAIIGNIVTHTGTKTEYELNGPPFLLTAYEASIRVLVNDHLNYMVGKIYRRHIIEDVEWDDHPSLTNNEDIMMLLTISAQMSGNILVVPSIHTYNYIKRPNSQSLTTYLRHDGMERMWNNLLKLNLPREELVNWGLTMIYKNFLLRGLPIAKDYKPVQDLIEMSSDVKLNNRSKHIIRVLKRPSLLKMPHTRAQIRDRQTTGIGARVSFIVPVFSSYKKLCRTVRSVFNTGFQNIELVIVDDGCPKKVRYEIRKLYIGNKRIKIVSHAERRGLAASRLSGLRVASGDIIVFVDAGDMVRREGLYEAFVKIDAGAELVVLNTLIYNPLLHIHRNYFNPTEIFSDGEVFNGTVLTKILTHDCVPNTLWNVALKRSALILPEVSTNTSNSIGMYLRALNVDYVETPAYVWCDGHAVHRSLADFWDRECQLTNLIISTPFSPPLSLARKQMVVNAMSKRMVLGIARRLSLPWTSKKAVLEQIKDNLNIDKSRAIYEEVELPVPEPEDILQQATALMHAHRGEFMLRWLLRF